MHPFVKIILFIFTLLLMSVLSSEYLWLMSISLCTYAAFIDGKNLLRLVKRMKWLFLSILIIFGLSTPGEYIRYFPTDIAPTLEGCALGFLQIAKLLVALATLNILFSTSSKEELMSGLHLLLSPLNLLGFNTNKFTARLLLTLDYVEEFTAKEKISFGQLDNMLLTTELYHKDKMIVLERFSFKWTDKVLIVVLAASTLVLFYFKAIF